jgi:hypothetical protein
MMCIGLGLERKTKQGNLHVAGRPGNLGTESSEGFNEDTGLLRKKKRRVNYTASIR